MIRRHPAIGRPSCTLLPGELFCERAPHRIGTILGSCVAVCLWSKRLRFGGMNHFLLPRRPVDAEPSNRFGDVAIANLIERMIALGSPLRDIQAKLFGGANVLGAGSTENSVGRQNVGLAVAELRRYRVPIVASRLAGNDGIVIVQCTACGDVWVRPVAGERSRKMLPRRIQELPWLSRDFDFGSFDDAAGVSPVLSTRSKIVVASFCSLCTSHPMSPHPAEPGA
jgi:chemotaxis protein CheD